MKLEGISSCEYRFQPDTFVTDRPACTLRGLPNTRRTPFDLLFIEIEWVSSVRDKQSVLADTYVDAPIVIAFLDSVARVLK
jgi:hypothetical protein